MRNILQVSFLSLTKMKNKLPNIKAMIRKIIGYPFLTDVMKNRQVAKKKALLVYIAKPFLLKPDDPRFHHHQNLKQSLQITSLLAEKGYSVDVLDMTNPNRHINAKQYDLVISHKVDFKADFSETAIKIYLATGLNHILHNRNVRARYDYLNGRRCCNLQAQRILPEHMPFVQEADYIFSFGNNYVKESWQSYVDVPIYQFNNYAFQSITQEDEKPYLRVKNNFLFFASGHQVGKGLDLALDVFSQLPDLNLYVCSSFAAESQFCKCFSRELFHTSNIHSIGWISIDSPAFKDLVRKCGFLFYPTCSEGSAGAVIQCMQAGLVPILTPQSGIDIENFAVPLNSYRVEDIKNVVLDLVSQSDNWYQNRLVKMREVLRTKYGEDTFNKRWKEMLTEVLLTQQSHI